MDVKAASEHRELTASAPGAGGKHYTEEPTEEPTNVSTNAELRGARGAARGTDSDGRRRCDRDVGIMNVRTAGEGGWDAGEEERLKCCRRNKRRQEGKK